MVLRLPERHGLREFNITHICSRCSPYQVFFFSSPTRPKMALVHAQDIIHHQHRPPTTPDVPRACFLPDPVHLLGRLCRLSAIGVPCRDTQLFRVLGSAVFVVLITNQHLTSKHPDDAHALNSHLLTHLKCSNYTSQPPVAAGARCPGTW